MAYLYISGQRDYFCLAKQDCQGNWISESSEETLDQLRQKYPTIMVKTRDELVLAINDVVKYKPQEISEMNFIEAYVDLRTYDYFENEHYCTFKNMINYKVCTTDIYVHLKKEDICFKFGDYELLTPEECIKIVEEHYKLYY
ncbi:hypothetical protein [Zophobihabitans entericus]|uniref:Uncharacterized protein n=1 Tax=Zophobihabitans entericus TaxID=1635327 RepID=A0A6G9ID44_9GAMM|nr:hypothetical protein [Zophobihabitans entericus]QIQ22156.1 hypothetical protein IPMB12_10950 [Zophobihabitans entericus]